MLCISYHEDKTNDYIWKQFNVVARRHKILLSVIKHCKLSLFGHVCRHNALWKTILQELMKGDRHRERSHKLWRDNIKE